MSCDKCIKGIIMKQIKISEFDAVQCDCTIDEWFNGLKT